MDRSTPLVQVVAVWHGLLRATPSGAKSHVGVQQPGELVPSSQLIARPSVRPARLDRPCDSDAPNRGGKMLPRRGLIVALARDEKRAFTRRQGIRSRSVFRIHVSNHHRTRLGIGVDEAALGPGGPGRKEAIL